MRGTKIWLLGGLTALVLSGCGLLPGTERTETEEVHVGDTVSTSWFDYTITSAPVSYTHLTLPTIYSV